MTIKNRRVGALYRERIFLIQLLLLAGCFSAGVILGQALSGKIPASTADELNRYLKDYFSLSDRGNFSARSFFSSLLLYFRYPLLAFLLGFASVGIFLLPAVSAAFGFFLSFSVCCFTAVFGGKGVLLALAVFGFRCLVTLPGFFLLAVPSFQNSTALAAMSFGRGKRVQPIRYDSDWWLRGAVVAAVLATGALGETLIVPQLLRAVLEKIII